MRKNKKHKIIIAGTGGITQKAYFPILTTMENVEICSIYSRTPAHVHDSLERWNIANGTSDLSDLTKLGASAAFILTNRESHFEIAQYFLENGLDVFMEKPLTVTSAEALELGQIAKEHGRILMTGFNRRYARLYQLAKKLMDGKAIRSAVIQKHRATYAYTTIQEAYLEDIIHQIDLIRFLCGEVEPLSTHINTLDGKLLGATSIMRMAEGGLVTLQCSYAAGRWQECATLHGGGVSIHVNAFEDLTMKNGDHKEIYGQDRAGSWKSDLWERGFIPEIDHFLHCVQTREEPLTNAFEAAKTQQLQEQLAALA